MEVMGAMDIVEVEAGLMICAMVAPMGVMENVPMGVKGLGKILPLLILKILTLVLEMEANILYILQVKNLYGGAKISLQFYHFYNSINQFFCGDCKSATKIVIQ